MPRRKALPSERPPRVIWTDAEKAKLVSRAVDTQQEHPDLAGLPLLRVAMQVLPPHRRRKLIAVTQAPWFEPSAAAEVRRRTTEARADGDLLPIARLNAEHNAAISDGQRKFLAFHEAWRSEACFNAREQVSLLSCILAELKTLNEKLGQPVPMIDPRDSRRPANGYRKPEKR